jgi:ABC-type transport system substrate-binding protein
VKRNPNYPGPRRAHFDAIVWRVHEDAGGLIAQVERGETDLTIFGEGLEPGGPIDEEWGAQSEAADAGDQRYFLAPGIPVDAIALNPTDRLLADRDVREAISLAIDRQAHAEVFDGIPEASLLTAAVPGHDRTTPADLEPDLERARALMAGRTGTVTVAVCNFFPGCEDWGRTLAEDLSQIGISVEVRAVDDPIAEAANPDARAGIVNVFGACECFVPDPARAIEDLIGAVPEGWLPDEILADSAALSALEDPKRTEGAARLADTLAAEEFYVLPFASYSAPHFFSERIGCQVPMANAPGINLVALCLRDP